MSDLDGICNTRHCAGTAPVLCPARTQCAILPSAPGVDPAAKADCCAETLPCCNAHYGLWK